MGLSGYINLAGWDSSGWQNPPTAPAPRKKADPALVGSIVDRILGLQGDATESAAASRAQQTTAAGYEAEAAAYESGAQVSEANARYARLAGDITELQAQRDLLRSVGDTRAAVAGGGFQQSGSAVAQVRASLQEGYLEQQLIRTQALFDEGGYLEQAASARSLAGASDTAQAEALNTASSYDAAAEQARVAETNLTSSLSSYLQTYGTSTETSLATSVIAGTDPTGALADLNPVTGGTARDRYATRYANTKVGRLRAQAGG